MFTTVSDEDFERLSTHAWSLNKTGYACRCATGADTPSGQMTLLMHRAVLNAPRKSEIDHVNGDKLDNRRENLRFCSRVQNLRNQPKRSVRHTQYLGVYPCGSNWKSLFSFNGEVYYIGVFAKQEEAARAYDARAFAVEPNFSKLNFPDAIWTADQIESVRLRLQEPVSGLQGVKRRGSGWTAVLWMNGRPRRLGQFKSPTQAAEAVQAAKAAYQQSKLLN